MSGAMVFSLGQLETVNSPQDLYELVYRFIAFNELVGMDMQSEKSWFLSLLRTTCKSGLASFSYLWLNWICFLFSSYFCTVKCVVRFTDYRDSCLFLPLASVANLSIWLWILVLLIWCSFLVLFGQTSLSSSGVA